MVNPLTAYAAGNLFASGDRTSGGSAVKSLFETSTAPSHADDPFGLLANARARAAGVSLQNQAEQGLRGPDGGLGRLTTILDELDGFLAQGEGGLDADARADLQTKVDNLLQDFRAIAGNAQLTNPALVDGTGLLDLGVGTPLSVGGEAEAAAARTTLERAVAASADAAAALTQTSELQSARNAVFGALTGYGGVAGYGADGALNPNDARALLLSGTALGLFA